MTSGRFLEVDAVEPTPGIDPADLRTERYLLLDG